MTQLNTQGYLLQNKYTNTVHFILRKRFDIAIVVRFNFAQEQEYDTSPCKY
ncbi:hypothetical protein [sulfur-oxidizing endosymbiont of Gigantopelta aegis]|uniref:hypothetical protein n=1 Tax=sulfur-oxidizing endosymbiont of Gigantopelta aegis TaxID=2794934 RepID=UPI0018DE1758|nr:hypothetical protein [sulfur-oxidizing endosymbiont of Gigantopelta aegis]